MLDTVKVTDEGEAVARRLEQLELASKAREAEEFLERVEEVHATVKGLIDGTVDAAELEKQQQREVLRKRAKEIRKEEAAARVRDELRMGRSGKGEGKRPYTYFCRFCHVEYELENLRCCNRCGRELLTRAQRLAELQQRVQELKEEKQHHASRKARWRRWLQTKKILRSSRLVVDYAAWERWEPSTDEDEKENEPPVTPADDANFQALEQDLQASARSRAGRRAAALRCKERGNNLFKNGDWSGALQAYEEGLEHARDVKELWTNKCLVLLKMQQYEEAHQAATRLLEYCEIFEDGYTMSSDICFKAYSRRALANRALRRFDDALADLQQAAELQPNDKQVQQLLQQTQQQVKQLQHLEQLHRYNECTISGGEKEQAKDPCKQSNETLLRGSEESETTDEEREWHSQHGKEPQPETAAQPLVAVSTLPEATEASASTVAEAAEPQASEVAGTAVAAEAAATVTTVGASPPRADAPKAGAEYSAASEGGAAPSRAAELEGRERENKEAAEIGVSLSRTHTEIRTAADREPKNAAASQVGSQTPAHMAGSTQATTTAAATPASPCESPSAGSSNGDNEGYLVSGTVSPPQSSTYATRVDQGVAPVNSNKTGSLSCTYQVPTRSIATSSISTTVTAGAILGPTRASREATSPDSQTPTEELHRVQKERPSSFKSPVKIYLGDTPAVARNAAEALKELQKLLHSAAVSGSFAAIDPQSLTVALQLLKFQPVKLAFCCSPIPHISTSPGNDRSTGGNISTKSTVTCSGEGDQQKQEATRHRVEDDHQADNDRQQEGKGGKDLQRGEASRLHRTFLDICVADLRMGALRVRRQRREKAEAHAATVKIDGQATDGAAAQEKEEKPDVQASSDCSFLHVQSSVELYPHACSPALKLLHAVCFVEEGNDGPGFSDRHSFSTVESHSCGNEAERNSNKASRNGNCSNGGSQIFDSKKASNSVSLANDATPPWLLEVCEAAAPYLLTITSELLQQFVLLEYCSEMAKNAETATLEAAHLGGASYCGCHSCYKVLPHFLYHEKGCWQNAPSQGTSECDAVEKLSPADDPSHCCAWGAGAAALAICMSLLQQLSVASLTRRKLADQLHRNSDGRAVLLNIPSLLLCCTYEALVSATGAPNATTRWPLWKQQLGANHASQGESFSSSSQCLSICSSKLSRNKKQNNPFQQSTAAAVAGKHLRQARTDAGAVLCNMLLEQPVLQQLLLPQQQTTCKTTKDKEIQPSHSNPQQQLQHNADKEQHASSKSYQQQHTQQLQRDPHQLQQDPQQDPQQLQQDPQQVHLLDITESKVVPVYNVLWAVLSRRLQAFLHREQLLQQAEEAGMALAEQLECGVHPLHLFSLLGKQVVFLHQQQQQQRESRARTRRMPQKEVLSSNIRHSFSKRLLLQSSNCESRRRNTNTLTCAAVDRPSAPHSNTLAAASHIEELLKTLLSSLEELEMLEAHANGCVTMRNVPTAEDPVLEEAQQALDIITNLGRSCSGRAFVLKHLQQELLQLLAISSGAAAEEVSETYTDRINRALSVVEKSSQQWPQQQQQELHIVEMLRELLTPRGDNRNRLERFLPPADVLGLLQNLTATSVFSSNTSLAVQASRQQVSPTSPVLTSLQQQLLLCGGTQLDMLPLLLPFIDKLAEEQQIKLGSGQGAAAPHAIAPVKESTPTYVAGLRSLTIASRLVAAAGALTEQSAASPGGGEHSAGQLHHTCQNKLLGPGSRSCTATAATATQQKHTVLGASLEHTEDITAGTSALHRDLIECLLPRVLRLLGPPTMQQQPHQETVPQPRCSALLQQASTGNDRTPWGDLHNASLLVLCALANLNVQCLLETAARAATTFGASNSAVAGNTLPQPVSSNKSPRTHKQAYQQTQPLQQNDAKIFQWRQPKDQAHTLSSSLREMARVICSWLQILKPRSYARERAEMRDPVAMARGNLLLLVGHLAKAQGAALNKQMPDELQQQGKHQGKACAGESIPEKGGQAAAKCAAATSLGERKVEEVLATDIVDVLQQELTELDLRPCIHCCIESLRKDLEGPQRNAAIALAALARIAKYRPSIEVLNGFESLVQIGPLVLGKRR